MNPTLKKVWNMVSTVLVALVVVLALLLAGARLVGLQVFTVLSGSMEIIIPSLIQGIGKIKKCTFAV